MNSSSLLTGSVEEDAVINHSREVRSGRTVASGLSLKIRNGPHHNVPVSDLSIVAATSGTSHHIPIGVFQIRGHETMAGEAWLIEISIIGSWRLRTVT